MKIVAPKKLFLSKFDYTQDYRGTFFAQGNWMSNYKKLKRLLEKRFFTTFESNKNSFDSCFQFTETKKDKDIQMNIKIYNKYL